MTSRRSGPTGAAADARGITAIQSKLDERFLRETFALFRARLLNTGLLLALVSLVLVVVDWISAATWSPDLPLGDFALLRVGTAAYLVVLTRVLAGEGRGPGQLVDFLLFLPPAVGLSWTMAVTGDVSSPYFGTYLALLVARTALVPGRRQDHLPVVLSLLLVHPVALVLFSSGFGEAAGWLQEEGRIGALLAQWFAVVVLAGVGLLGSDMTHAMHERLVSARSVGRYKIQKELGRGAMGVVYLAWHRDLGRPCVIKFVHPEKDGSGALRHRFEREARETSLLRSPYTVQVFDFGLTNNGQLFYVMEYLEGESLQERLKKGGPQPFDLVCRWLSFACESLAEAHARSLIHRDIKPANLFLARTADGREAVKVLDFGIARKEQAEQPELILSTGAKPGLPSGPDLTAVGTVMGTPLYVAPEVLSGRPASPKADQYSLAASGFHLLTGRPVFTGKSIDDLLRKTLRDEAPGPSQVASKAGIPDALDRVLLRALSKDPEARYPSMEAFRRALEPFAAAAGTTRSVVSGD